MVLTTVGALAFLAFAVLMAGSGTTARAAADARALHWVNATSGALAATRASLSQAVLFQMGADAGFSDAEAAQRAYDEAAVSLARAEEWVADMDATAVEDAGLQSTFGEFLQGGRAVLAALGDGDPAEADEVFAERIEAPWAALEIELIARQQGLAEAIADAEGFSGFVSALSRVMLLLVVPAGAVLAYRAMAKREQRETRVRLEAELTAEQELGQMRSHFIAGVSHELRTPLTSVVGFSHLLLDGGLDAATAREFVYGISGEAEELARMVDDLLVASRPDGVEVPLHMEDCAVSAEVEAVVAPYRRLGKTVHLRMENAVVRVDPGRLRQIVRNLLSNAFKHGGPTIWISGAPRVGDYLLMVADDGPGVGPEIAGRLFQPFAHRGDSAVVSGSVGLGLSVARQLATSMGGDLTYKRVEEWTQFLLRVPLGAGAAGGSTGLPAGAWSDAAT